MAFPQPMDDNRVLQISIKLSEILKTGNDDEELVLDSGARELWGRVYPEINTDDSSLKSSLTARSEAYVIRLALLFALLDSVNKINVNHLNAAIFVVEYCNDSAAYIFTHADDSDNDDSKKLLAALSKKPLTQTDISHLFDRNKTRMQMKKLLDGLQSRGRCQPRMG